MVNGKKKTFNTIFPYLRKNHVKSLVTRMGSKPGRRIRRYVDFETQLLPLNIFILAGFFLFSQAVLQTAVLQKSKPLPIDVAGP
jgi:hypothetical protein